MMIKAITSAQNPWLKDVVLLQEKSRFRKQMGRFTVEGLNEIRLALKSGLRLMEIAINPKRMDWESLNDVLALTVLPVGVHQLELNDVAWSKVVVKESGQNALAVFELPKEMPAWDPKEGEFYLMVESVEKPGNLGALLRNSVGTTFTVHLFVMTSAQAWDKIQHNKVRLYTTFMESSVSVWQSDLTGCLAMLVGTEHQGVSEFWRDKGENINIPMFGSVDSLNVSVAASLLLYEAKRQRERLGL